MDPALFTRLEPTVWRIEPHGAMRVPGILFADEALIRGMDDKVYTQTVNVATLPGIVGASYAMPDAHWGYGFPIGGVAAFDPEADGVISAGGVGFDISCGVRLLATGLSAGQVVERQQTLADRLFETVPAGDYVLIDVVDSGSGIAKEDINRIWEPFFSTKGVGEGTGLGLSTVYGIVRQTGGFVFAENLPGAGASFVIVLPRYQGLVDQPAAGAAAFGA